MTYITYSTKDRIAIITLNRPNKHNALSYDMVTELKSAFSKAEQDPSVTLVMLKANGESFCAGADIAYLKRLRNFSYEENLADSNHLKELFYQIYTLKKIVIAQIQGHALAGGCGLATLCDFSFSVPEAKFGYTEVKIGFVPAIVMIFLIRKIGEGKARELLLTGELIAAQQAAEYGLINWIVPKDKLEEEAEAFAEKLIVSNSAHAMMMTKQMIGDVQSVNLKDALTFAAKKNAEARGSDDYQRGIALFLNKEKISW